MLGYGLVRYLLSLSSMLYLIFGFLLGAASIIFALQNTAIVALSFLGWQFESSLALVIIIAIAVGALIGILASLPSIIDKSFRIMGLKRENRKLAEHAEKIQQHSQELADSIASAPAVVVVDPPATVDLRS